MGGGTRMGLLLWSLWPSMLSLAVVVMVGDIVGGDS